MPWERSTSPAISATWEATRQRLRARAFFFLSPLLFILSISSPAFAYTIAPSLIGSDTVWQKNESPFVLSSNLTIDPDAKLSIEPGVIIAISGDLLISVNGILNVGDIGSEQVTVDSTIDLAGDYPEFDDFASDGSLSFSISGATDIFNAAVSLPVSFYSESADIRIFNADVGGGEMVFNRSQIEIRNSSFDSMESVMLKNQSSASIIDSRLSGSDSSGFLFNIFEGSRIGFERSEISPGFLDFALLLDGSKFSATSTLISGMDSYGIQASRGSKVSLYDVEMDTIFSPISSSAFVMLVGSDAIVADSVFRETASNAVELYQSSGVPSSLSMKNSIIEDFGFAGISAVHASVSIKDSVIRRGTMGIENIFSSTTISNSEISENSEYGITAYVPGFTVRAENNFWGDASGPRHHILNPGGLSNAVSDNVTFNPWLAADPKLLCCSSVLFLPGLEASRLYDDTGRLWEPSISSRFPRLFMSIGGESVYSDIYASGVIDEVLVPVAGPNIYKSFIARMDDLKIAGTIEDWKPIPYDWRLPFDALIARGKEIPGGISYIQSTSSPYILQELKRLAASSKTGKVTIIAHSNGGILAKALMMKLSETGLVDLIDKLIFVAVPQIGTPQAIGALLHGYGQEIPFLLSAKEAMDLSLNMPSAYNLLPSDSYFDSVRDPVIRVRESGMQVSSSTEFYDFLDGKGLNALLLGKSEITHKSLDEWLPPLGTELIQIAGWGIDTISGIEYFQGKKRGKPVLLHKPLMVLDGDNTVLVPSALYLSTSTPNVKRYWLDLGKYNSSQEKISQARVLNRKHADIFEIDELGKFIVKLIRKEEDVPSYFSTSTPKSGGNAKRLHFTLHSASHGIQAYDGFGRYTGASTTTLSAEEGIPDTYYRELGEVKHLSVPTGSRGINIIIKDEDSVDSDPDSFTLGVDEVHGDIIASTTSFADISSPSRASFALAVPESISLISHLEVDEDGDEVIDSYIPAGEESIIIKSDESMKTETQVPAVSINLHQGLSQRRKTTLYEIQELIDAIQLPDLAEASTTKGIKIGLKPVEGRDLQAAAVFYGEPNLKNTLRSLLSIIIDILRKILLWLFNLFT